MKRKLLIIMLLLLLIAAFAYFHYYEKKGEKKELTLYGNVDIRQVDLGFRVLGRVLDLHYEEGDHVKPGDLMAVLDKVPYQNAIDEEKAKIESIKASLSNSKKMTDRRADLITIGGVSQEDYDDALSQQDVYKANLNEAYASLAIATTSLEDTDLLAPSEGTILTRIREPGTIVLIGDPVYTLSLDNPIWVRAYISESNLGQIFPGMKAQIHSDTPSMPTFEGHVGFISPVAEFTPKTVESTSLRTDLVYRLRIIVDDPNHFLRQGMPVTVTFPLNQSEDKPTVNNG